ncbi:MAG: acyl-CoA thioesterase [Planctomycetaceae bacterium]
MDQPLSFHDIPIRVRYAETDAMGFLHHSNYLVYFEEARTELFRVRGGSYRRMEEMGFFFVVVGFQIRYHAPARYDDLLTVKVRESRQTAVKLEHEYEIWRDGAKLCSATSVLACTDRAGNVQRLTEVLPRVMGSSDSPPL